MQHIQDKDLDKLFRDRFEEAEIAPSPRLWAAIESEIKPKQKKKTFPVFWSAAASVAVLITAILVLNKEEKMNLQGFKKPAESVAIAPVVVNEEPETTATPVVRIAAPVSTAKTNKVLTLQQPLQTEEKKVEIPQQQMVARVEQPKPVIKNEQKTLTETPREEVIYAADPVITSTEVSNENEQAERTKIRNVGDLVNFVVDKVDKRENKAIRFKTEDDESSIIGLNIGFLKFNSKKKDR